MGCLRRLIAILLGCTCVFDFVKEVKSEKDAVETFLSFFEDEKDWREVIVPEKSRAFPDSHSTQKFEDEPSVPKRRRLRKRKRRPVTTSTETNYRYMFPKVSHQASTLQDSWEEMLKEPQVPYTKRRKNPPKYELDPTNPTLTVSLRLRDENTDISRMDVDSKRPISSEKPDKLPDIKTLLKQAGQLSLSELLQKKNLTLSELLKGSRKAISALKSTTTEYSEDFAESRRDEQKIVQANIEFEPAIILAATEKGTINRNFESEDYSTEVFKEENVIKHPSTHKYINMYSGVTKFEVVTEPTTEKRIFVSSHPALYTSVTYKNQSPLQGIFSTPKPKTSTIQSSTNKNLPITNAKLKKIIQLKDTFSQDNRIISNTTLPPNAIKIDITEIFGFTTKKTPESIKSNQNTIDKNINNKNEKGPLKFSFDFNFTTQKTTTQKPEVKITQKVETLPNKYKPLTPRDEIIQIIKDPRDKDNLLGILEKRNMTLEELIEQRKRGSSNTHLADIFHDEIKEPEPSGETYVGHMDMSKNYASYTRKQKSLLEDTTISRITKITTSSILPQKIIVTSFPAVKIEMQKSVPKKLGVNKEKIMIPDSIQFTNSREEDRIVLLDDNFLEDRIPVHNSHGKLYIPSEPLYIDEEVLLNVPSGVKSAILASFAIIGLSLLVFLSILIVFRWNQKRKNKLNYCENFGFRRSKSPIISVPNKKIKTFVNETLGNKKNPYKPYMHTSMDNLWETKLRNNY